jgi:uncharacterized membrane protein YdbT with pleckstrin-like domain
MVPDAKMAIPLNAEGCKMTYVESILEPGERITYRGRLHWMIYLRGIMLLLIGAAIFIGKWTASIILADQSWPSAKAAANAEILATITIEIGLFLLFIGLIFLLVAAIIRRTTEIAITTQKVILKSGIIRRSTIEMNRQKIESVDVHQSIFGRILNYGTIIVRGTGSGFNPLAYIAAPLRLRRAITN